MSDEEEFTIVPMEGPPGSVGFGDKKELSVHHYCVGREYGPFVVFTCPQCPDYLRRIHRYDRKMTIRGDSPMVSHSGLFIPPDSLESSTIN